MAKTGAEKQLQKDLQYSLGCSFAGNHYIRVTHPDQYEESGKPDLIGHIFGVHVEIELKVDSNRPSASQKEQIRRVSESGGFACVIVHHRKDGEYYIVTPKNVEDFTYRGRKEKWTRIPHGKVMVLGKERVVLNLNGLYTIMTQRLKEIYK